MHDSNPRRGLASRGLARIVSRIMVLSVAGFGLTACATYDSGYRQYGHHGYGYGSGSHVTRVHQRPAVVYRTHRAAPRPHHQHRRVAPRRHPKVHAGVPGRPPHVRSPSRRGHHARPGAVHRPGNAVRTRPAHVRPSARPGQRARPPSVRRPDAQASHRQRSQARSGGASAQRPAVRRNTSGRGGARSQHQRGHRR